eukprot:1141171-Pelagomonas_calceolata.AAC.1
MQEGAHQISSSASSRAKALPAKNGKNLASLWSASLWSASLSSITDNAVISSLDGGSSCTATRADASGAPWSMCSASSPDMPVALVRASQTRRAHTAWAQAACNEHACARLSHLHKHEVLPLQQDRTTSALEQGGRDSVENRTTREQLVDLISQDVEQTCGRKMDHKNQGAEEFLHAVLDPLNSSSPVVHPRLRHKEALLGSCESLQVLRRCEQVQGGVILRGQDMTL